MFDNWKHKLPTREKIFASRWFKPFAHLFDKPEYWAFKRDKVALSVAIGLFCGMLPAPTQFVSALIMAYFLRTQLPIALFSTLYTNPLTLIPLYVAAYKLGSRLLYGTAAQAELVMPALGEYELAECAAGLRPMTPDNMPIVGRLDDRTLVATGHGRSGFLLAP